MLKNMFNAGKCLLGFHVGAWQYEKLDACLEFQICENCQKCSTRTEHTWTKWDYEQDEDCQQARICTRCQENEKRTVHVWSTDAYYKNDGDCTAVNYCDRCGIDKLYGTVHKWEEWVYLSTDSCEQSQKCSRCEMLGTEKQIEHMWGEWQYSAFYQARVITCEHCGLMPLNFEATTTYSLTIQDVDILFRRFVYVTDVNEIAKLFRANKFIFDQPINPVLNAYLRFVDNHMPEGTLKSFYGHLGEHCKVWGEIGSEAILSELEKVGSQPGQDAWSLAFSAITLAAKKKYAPKPDTRLVGHWRFTDTLMGGGFSSATDYHLILDANGNCLEQSHTVSANFGNQWGDPVSGKWSTQDNVLTIEYPDGTSSQLLYHIEENSLFFPNATNRRLWERVR